MSNYIPTLQLTLLFLIILLNIRTYYLFYIDKKRAIARKRNRISEKKLLVSAFLFGGVGALIGMTTMRHKTKHTQFQILIPLAAVITVSLIFFLISYAMEWLKYRF